MYITDVKAEPVDSVKQVDVIDMPRKDGPYFASVLETQSTSILRSLEKSLLDDQGNRGISHLYLESDFVRASLALSHARRVAVTTGFPVHQTLDVKEETDGLPGALAVCQGLLALGREVVLISDNATEKLFRSCVEHEVTHGVLKGSVRVLTCSEATAALDKAPRDSPPWDCLVAIERVGRSKDGKHYTMRGIPVSVEPVEDLFLAANSHPLVSTVAIGDGGNELGMGKVYDQVVKHIPEGGKIACVVPADFVVVAGVSNWAGYALSLALYVLSLSPAHWRYRNYGVDADHTPSLDMSDFVPTEKQVSTLNLCV